MKKHTLIKSSDQTSTRMIWILYGPPGAGKTWAAMTLSSKWPKNPTLNKRPITIDDVLYWQWDNQGSIGLLPHKIKLKYVLDMPAAISEHGFARAVRLALKESRELIMSDPKITIEIHDTITALDMYSLQNIEASGIAINDSTGDVDTRKMFGKHLENHRLYAAETFARPERINSIYLFHEKFIDEDMVKKSTKTTQEKVRSKKVGDMRVSIVPATVGAGDQFYLRAVSTELSVVATAIPGKPGKFKRMLHPLTHEGRRAKCRFQHTLTEKMPCDLKLVLEKIRGSLK